MTIFLRMSRLSFFRLLSLACLLMFNLQDPNDLVAGTRITPNSMQEGNEIPANRDYPTPTTPPRLSTSAFRLVATVQKATYGALQNYRKQLKTAAHSRHRIASFVAWEENCYDLFPEFWKCHNKRLRFDRAWFESASKTHSALSNFIETKKRFAVYYDGDSREVKLAIQQLAAIAELVNYAQRFNLWIEQQQNNPNSQNNGPNHKQSNLPGHDLPSHTIIVAGSEPGLVGGGQFEPPMKPSNGVNTGFKVFDQIPPVETPPVNNPLPEVGGVIQDPTKYLPEKPEDILPIGQGNNQGNGTYETPSWGEEIPDVLTDLGEEGRLGPVKLPGISEIIDSTRKPFVVGSETIILPDESAIEIDSNAAGDTVGVNTTIQLPEIGIYNPSAWPPHLSTNGILPGGSQVIGQLGGARRKALEEYLFNVIGKPGDARRQAFEDYLYNRFGKPGEARRQALEEYVNEKIHWWKKKGNQIVDWHPGSKAVIDAIGVSPAPKQSRFIVNEPIRTYWVSTKIGRVDDRFRGIRLTIEQVNGSSRTIDNKQYKGTGNVFREISPRQVFDTHFEWTAGEGKYIFTIALKDRNGNWYHKESGELNLHIDRFTTIFDRKNGPDSNRSGPSGQQWVKSRAEELRGFPLPYLISSVSSHFDVGTSGVELVVDCQLVETTIDGPLDQKTSVEVSVGKTNRNGVPVDRDGLTEREFENRINIEIEKYEEAQQLWAECEDWFVDGKKFLGGMNFREVWQFLRSTGEIPLELTYDQFIRTRYGAGWWIIYLEEKLEADFDHDPVPYTHVEAMDAHKKLEQLDRQLGTWTQQTEEFSAKGEAIANGIRIPVDKLTGGGRMQVVAKEADNSRPFPTQYFEFTPEQVQKLKQARRAKRSQWEQFRANASSAFIHYRNRKELEHKNKISELLKQRRALEEIRDEILPEWLNAWKNAFAFSNPGFSFFVASDEVVFYAKEGNVSATVGSSIFMILELFNLHAFLKNVEQLARLEKIGRANVVRVPLKDLDGPVAKTFFTKGIASLGKLAPLAEKSGISPSAFKKIEILTSRYGAEIFVRPRSLRAMQMSKVYQTHHPKPALFKNKSIKKIDIDELGVEVNVDEVALINPFDTLYKSGKVKNQKQLEQWLTTRRANESEQNFEARVRAFNLRRQEYLEAEESGLLADLKGAGAVDSFGTKYVIDPPTGAIMVKNNRKRLVADTDIYAIMDANSGEPLSKISSERYENLLRDLKFGDEKTGRWGLDVKHDDQLHWKTRNNSDAAARERLDKQHLSVEAGGTGEQKLVRFSPNGVTMEFADSIARWILNRSWLKE